MIVRPQQHWLRMLFVWNGSVLQAIMPQLAIMLGVSVLAVATGGRILGEKMLLSTAPFTLCGVALTIFLAFRNNRSYDRYWEARTLWGNLLISARTLTSQMLAYVPTGSHEGSQQFDRDAFVRSLMAFAYALKHQLRDTDPYDDLEPLVGAARAIALKGRQYRPVAILNDLRTTLGALHKRGALDGTQLWMLDAQLNELEKIVGGCERIASTPIPFAYGVLLHRTVYAYCFLLPFGLVESVGVFTPLITVFVSYTLIALEAIAGDIAEPFGTAPNNLALDAMTRTIERSLLELCDEPVPAEVVPGPKYRMT
ncbi:bestrophin family protein [Paraburkholderia kururiensis]|uniref:Bestrophin family ion channel n=1 Tax=Paraburkholderia kururiensis TaxID=984307 RepID=A0ABZ0WTC5_9BURK|nr:bestrophin family ion channel [Paraburkholderia kururiensis]WQD80496.1 bestrophin family ion channel [Paraburkholderia kururiensis]